MSEWMAITWIPISRMVCKLLKQVFKILQTRKITLCVEGRACFIMGGKDYSFYKWLSFFTVDTLMCPRVVYTCPPHIHSRVRIAVVCFCYWWISIISLRNFAPKQTKSLNTTTLASNDSYFPGQPCLHYAFGWNLHSSKTTLLSVLHVHFGLLFICILAHASVFYQLLSHPYFKAQFIVLPLPESFHDRSR